jgi:opine dehydrogenase
MKISAILPSACALAAISAKDKQAAISQLVSALGTVRGIEVELALKDLAARERAGPTLVPVGRYHVAIPHACTDACRQLVVAVGSSRQGIVWGPAGRAHLVVLLMAPPPARGPYLRVLSRIARLCEMPGFLESMLQSVSSQELIERLASAEKLLGELVPDQVGDQSGTGSPTFCVLGGGHGGMAMAAHLAITGFKVNLFNHNVERLLPVLVRGGIDVTGEIEGFASLNIITSDPAEATAGADILMVVVPATGHRDIAELIAPHLKDGQIVVLNPGRTGGTLEVAKVIRNLNPSVRPYLAEAQTLLYASRVTNPGQVRIFSIKNSVPLATLPAYQVTDILPVIRKALPQFVPGDNVLKTGLDNIGAVFHPAITVLNAARIEDTHGDFEYYVEGVTRSVASVLEAIDRERVQVASALGIRVNTAREWLYLAYNAAGRTLLDAMRANRGYRGIMAPGTLDHRYITEDVPASLVPIASIGEMLKVPTPAIRAIIHLASLMHGVDYWAAGRTVERLGIQGMSVKDIQFLVVGVQPTPQEPSGIPGPDLL